MKFIRGEDVKITSERHKEALLAEGWKVDDGSQSLDTEALKLEAEELGIKVHHNAKPETILKKIAEAKDGNSKKAD